MANTKREAVYNEYGDLVGYLEARDDHVEVYDANGYFLLSTRSDHAARRHLLNEDYNLRTYLASAKLIKRRQK